MTYSAGSAAGRIDDGPMNGWQWVAVLMTAGLNALDGIDVLSISYAAPGIAAHWGVAPGALGWILAMELLGMAAGSLLLGGVADRIGRRHTILGCLVAMATGMLLAGQATGPLPLLGARLLTGLGIGGMLPAINAAAAELSNRRRRSLAMALMVIGYPIGGILGGLAARAIFDHGGGWQDLFHLGGTVTLAFIPLVWLLLPETPAHLESRGARGDLARLNRTLARFGHASVRAIDGTPRAIPRGSLAALFGPGFVVTTLCVTVAYFAHIMSFYFIIKWVPKMVVDLGADPATAASLLAWANVGGACGGALFGLLAARTGLKRLTLTALLGSAIFVALFGLTRGTPDILWAKLLVTGLFANSAIAGLYLTIAVVFPPELRAAGTGFAIGVGRGAAALAPVAAGYMFQAGMGIGSVAVAMGCGSVIAAAALSRVVVPADRVRRTG